MDRTARFVAPLVRALPGLPRVQSAARLALLPALVACGPALIACGPAGSSGADPAFPPLAKKWYDRGLESFRGADIADAESAVASALRIAPEHEDVRMLGARVALAKLDYDRCVELLQGLDTGEARGLRGRAHWYAGRIDRAADELEALLADPGVRDEWAENVAKLARRGGGRTPFRLSGGMLGYGEMPRVSQTNLSLIIPVEVNGEEGLGLVHTGYAETVIDGSGDPAWISLRFGDTRQPDASHLEVKDVPAITKDLSGLSRQMNAPIKVLLGVNLLRHIHPTFDFEGGQFVVRSFEPPPPPAATTVRVAYVRGGGMVMRSALGREASSPHAALFVDTSMNFPFAFAETGWKKAGVTLASLQAVPGAPQLKRGVIPFMQLGAFALPNVEAVHLAEPPTDLEMQIDGTIGAPLFAAFRITLHDGGRALWLEDHPARMAPPEAPPAEEEPEGKELKPPTLEGPPGAPGAPGADDDE
ncbi:MAG: hypothetical protein KIT72_06195 [Polyangiaceae bacterium]|nr:hypothetical protein [Polyangiaceae bacterium]MCW5789991.1 hypothetical protein [Polyangiaceae bacterium]